MIRPSTLRRGACALLVVVIGSGAAAARTAAAQTVLDRSPNLSGDWVGTPGVLHFNFLHRFVASEAPERKVSSAPTFLLAAGLPGRTLLGFHYATNSQLSPDYPNEWEFFGRIAAVRQGRGAPVDVGAQLGYNLAAKGPDGEVSVARREGPVRVMAAGRLLSDPAGDGTDPAVAAGVVVRLTRGIAVSADAATLTDRPPGEKVAWGAGIQVLIPRTPHTLSLHATNSNNGTLQGASRGTDDTRYGFEFTIPVTLSRYFGGGPRRRAEPSAPSPETPPAAQPPAAPPAAKPDTAPGARAGARTPTPASRDTVQAHMEDFVFQPSRMEVTAGTTIVWTNQGQVAHSATMDDGSFDSGILDSGRRGGFTFMTAGTYPFHCTPHPFMKGVVVVRAP